MKTGRVYSAIWAPTNERPQKTTAVIAALDDFRGPLEKNDDVTLVVIKIDG